METNVNVLGLYAGLAVTVNRVARKSVIQPRDAIRYLSINPNWRRRIAGADYVFIPEVIVGSSRKHVLMSIFPISPEAQGSHV